MSHIECGPLAQYNSLTDHHLSGYFNNTRIKKHLTKSGLVSKSGDVIPETVYRMTNARREHRKNIRNLLAQAIVHKTLDLERTRQVTIRKKLEEISKIELVRRVRADRHRKGDEELLTFFTPRMQKREKQKPRKIASEDGSVQDADDMSNEEDKDDFCPDSSHRQRLAKHFPKAEIDTRNLATLDSVALREYAKVLEQLDRQNTGRKSTLTSLNSFRRSSDDYSSRVAKNPPPSTKKSRPQSSKYAASDEASFTKDKKKGRMVLHRTEPALLHQTRLQSLVEISMRFMGSTNKVALACLDGEDKSQEVMIEQQHCGGNTLIVFRERLLANSKFSFVSRRHKGFPFSLSLYIDGVKDSRLSSCCEYRHRPGAKLGGQLGHFVFLSAKGAAPCYRCQVEKEEKKKKKKKKEKKEPDYEEDFDGDAASEADTAVKDVQDEAEEETEKTDPEKVEPEEESFIPLFETPRRKTSSASSSCDSSKSFASLEQVDAAENAEETQEDDEEDDERETAVLGYGTEEEEEEESSAKNVTVIADVHQQDKNDCNEEIYKYSILVYTADIADAGTNCQVFLNIVGSDAESGTQKLVLSDAENPAFQRAGENIFQIETINLGKIQSLSVWIDAQSGSKNWLLEKIVVACKEQDTVVQFPCNQWLTDQFPRRVLLPLDEADVEPFLEETKVEPLALDLQKSISTEDSSSPEPSDTEDDSASDEELTQSESSALTSSATSSSRSSTNKVEKRVDDSNVSTPRSKIESDSNEKLHQPAEMKAPIVHRGSVLDFFNRETVAVYNTCLSDSQMDAFVNQISSAEKLENFSIRNGNIDDDKLEVILNVLKLKSELKCLNLNCNKIGPRGAHLIAQHLKYFSQLDTLLLHGNVIMDDGVYAIVHSLLEKYVLKDGTINAEKPRMRSVDLGDSEMTNQGAFLLGKLISTNLPIESLELTGNRKIGVEGWRHLGSCLKNNTQLTSLAVDYCDFKDESLKALISKLEENRCLKTLDLEGNEITNEGAMMLKNLVETHDTLCDVILTPGNSDIDQDLLQSIEDLCSKKKL